ncbi:probable receptor-like protein kinase At2g47060 [Amborella trichopoda]|uniref:Protein kinase domain-containing protein n=1 Tax=Amborella trichopoda TaxID=13333 RepID=W1NFV8_AMBTC|nr:probable receptor-like protein kinase At2g47060 [Amborella trichopoda]ERM94084.1 hypothetical protein AMTR_s00010p00106530 [Amborella trichopoda]|eukprot:XP_006826847.1 probable receptor-like protein kinase At2g47060 [Amborella trichopoda]
MGCSQSIIDSDERDESAELGISVGCDPNMKVTGKKKIWGFRLLFVGKLRTQQNEEEKTNKAWLLGDSEDGECREISGVIECLEPQSVHSSFRFSFGSQMELEGLNPTVLLVNLERETGAKSHEPASMESQWRRIQSLERNISPVSEKLTRFSYSEVQSATKNFSRERVLGRGAHSLVYRGNLGFGRFVAIKCLDNDDKESGKAFCRELQIAGSLDHGNIVPLLGFCIDPLGLFLVYKFISGGSLDHHLHEKKGKSSMAWPVRYKVAVGVAQAVEYLHYGTDKCVVHRDIKPSNILLSSNKTAKLCDFGLATWTEGASIPFLCKTVKGTFGYLAPEYFQHGKVSEKTDVYAFGVVLLELITGREPIENKRPPGEENLVLWAKPLLHGQHIDELLDQRIRLETRYRKQVQRMVQAAASCLSTEEARRPSMAEVARLLRGRDEKFYSEREYKIGHYHSLEQFELRNEIEGHMALAMMGVADLEDDHQNRVQHRG